MVSTCQRWPVSLDEQATRGKKDKGEDAGMKLNLVLAFTIEVLWAACAQQWMVFQEEVMVAELHSFPQPRVSSAQVPTLECLRGRHSYSQTAAARAPA